MKVLVSTKETQGKRKNDFCFVPEGELVTFGSECSREAVDGSCGCRRAMSGVESSKGTTTFKIAELDMTLAELKDRLAEGLVKGGWVESKTSSECQKLVKESSDEILRIARIAPVGTILEKRGVNIVVRQSPKKEVAA